MPEQSKDLGIPNTINTHMISKVFIDTNVFVALRDETDSTHTKAVHFYEILKSNNTKFITSSDIIAESLTVISRKLGKKSATDFLDGITAFAKEIFINENLHKETRKLFRRIKSKNVSFVDCSSVITMKKNKLDTIFSFDEDFKNLGVKLVEDVA